VLLLIINPLGQNGVKLKKNGIAVLGGFTNVYHNDHSG
jgi:hypothetical protein